MNQEQLTKAVEDGVKSAIWKILLTIVLTLLVAEIIVVGLMFYGNHKQAEWEKEVCGEAGCPIQAVNRCVLDRLDCYVVDESLIEYTNQTGGGALPIIQRIHSICGYQEANAWFEQYKHQINGGKELWLKCE